MSQKWWMSKKRFINHDTIQKSYYYWCCFTPRARGKLPQLEAELIIQRIDPLIWAANEFPSYWILGKSTQEPNKLPHHWKDKPSPAPAIPCSVHSGSTSSVSSSDILQSCSLTSSSIKRIILVCHQGLNSFDSYAFREMNSILEIPPGGGVADSHRASCDSIEPSRLETELLLLWMGEESLWCQLQI